MARNEKEKKQKAKKLEKREAQKKTDKKAKQRHQDRKNIGKRRKPSASTIETAK